MPIKSSQVILARGFLVPADWPNATVEPATKVAPTTPITRRCKYIRISFRCFLFSMNANNCASCGLSIESYSRLRWRYLLLLDFRVLRESFYIADTARRIPLKIPTGG